MCRAPKFTAHIQYVTIIGLSVLTINRTFAHPPLTNTLNPPFAPFSLPRYIEHTAPGELERAAALSNFNRTRRRVRRGRAIFLAGIPGVFHPSCFPFRGNALEAPEEKLIPCSFHARNPQGLVKTGEGGRGGGDVFPATRSFTASPRPSSYRR